MRLGLARGETREYSPQTQRLVREVDAHPLVARRRGITLGEDQIDHAQNGAEPRSPLAGIRDLERHLRRRERLLGTHNALLDGADRHQKQPRDLLGGQAADHPQRERHLGFAREHGMAGDEHETEHVVVDGLPVIHGGTGIVREIVGNPAVLVVQPFLPSPGVDGSALRDGREPGSRVCRDA